MENLKRNDEIVATRNMQLSSDHHVGCTLVYNGHNSTGMLTFWCVTHQQWTYAFPTGHTFHYQGFPDLQR